MVNFNYYVGRDRLWDRTIQETTRCSPFWRGVLTSAEPLKSHIGFRLGNGSSIRFWEDCWCGEWNLKTRYPELYDIASDRGGCVADFWNSGNWQLSFVCLLSRSRMQALANMLQLLGNFRCSDGSDELLWNLESSGRFSVNSLYKSFFANMPNDSLTERIWKIKAPLKVRITFWLAMKKKLLTSDVLARRNIAPPFACPLCGNTNENADHLFLKCDFATSIWKHFQVAFRLRCLPNDLASLESTWRRRWISKKIEGKWDSTSTAIIWMIWHTRNGKIFEDKRGSVEDVIRRISSSVSAWERLS